jgi:hypothetical protein
MRIVSASSTWASSLAGRLGEIRARFGQLAAQQWAVDEAHEDLPAAVPGDVA